MRRHRRDLHGLAAIAVEVGHTGTDRRAARTFAFEAVGGGDDRGCVDDGAAAVVLAIGLQRDLIGAGFGRRFGAVHDCSGAASDAADQAGCSDESNNGFAKGAPSLR